VRHLYFKAISVNERDLNVIECNSIGCISLKSGKEIYLKSYLFKSKFNSKVSVIPGPYLLEANQRVNWS